MAQNVPALAFAHHPDTTPRERRAWEQWVHAAKRNAVTDADRAELLPVIRAWTSRRAQVRRWAPPPFKPRTRRDDATTRSGPSRANRA